MAMLAEPRFKRKISINPNGNEWSNDDSKFGQKLLEKFGWSEGKGLGAKEDGISNHIKVDYKFGNKGVGYKKNQSDNWIAHQDDFNAILADLNDGNPEQQQTSVSSIESTSKKSRSRVHYQKFVQGKDLSRRSATDLDSIFGVRKGKKQGKKGDQEEEMEEPTSTVQTEVDSGSLVTYNSTQSLQEYFAQKMAQRKKDVQPVTNQDETATTSDLVESGSMSEKKKHKKKRKERAVEEEAELEETRVKFYQGDEADDIEIVKKKKKKRKIVEEDEVVEISEESVKKSKKSKKKQKEGRGSSEDEESGLVVDSSSVKESENKDKNKDDSCQVPKELKAESSDDVEVPRKKKKKSKKGELASDVKETDSRARRVVFDSEGNLERVEDTQGDSVNISKESYMKTFMPNYTEKMQAASDEKQTVMKKNRTRRSNTLDRQPARVKKDKRNKTRALSKPEKVPWNTSDKTSVKGGMSVKEGGKSGINSKKNGSQKPRIQRKSARHGSQRASISMKSAFSQPSKKKKTLCSRNQLRKNLPHEIETKLPSVLQVFKSRGASMHTIGGVYEKPVVIKSKTVKTLSKNQRKKQLRNSKSTDKSV